MPLLATDRAQALMTTIQANNPNCGKLSPDEQNTFMQALQAIVGTDTGYLVANTTVLPAGLSANPGIPVQVATLSGTGATTGPGPLIGTGKIS